MTNKTPYELRYDLLQFARNNLMEKYYLDYDLYKEGKTSNNPELPTTESIFALADKYKTYIETK